MPRKTDLDKALANARHATHQGDIAEAERWTRVAEKTAAYARAKADLEVARTVIRELSGACRRLLNIVFNEEGRRRLCRALETSPEARAIWRKCLAEPAVQKVFPEYGEFLASLPPD